jgi:protein involved in polysaccharide export with SLBB domain
VKIPVGLPDGTEVLGSESTGNSTPPAAVPIERPLNPDEYICGSGDVFEVVFWGKQNFRLQIAANLEGNVFISKIGFLRVAGKSLTAVRQAVRKAVRGSYPGLSFELTLLRPRGFLVHVAENVKSSGAYTSSALERVSSLIARAGGSTGSRRRITIVRADGKKVTADLVLYELTGDTKYNPYMLDGDVVRVPFAETVVTITGSVKRPGNYELVAGRDLAELVELAGGLKNSVSKGAPIRLVRRNAQQRPAYSEIPFGDEKLPNVELRDEDTILIRDASELQQSILLYGAAGGDAVDTATSIRRLTYVERDTVRSILERIGGVPNSGDLKRAYITRPRKGEQPILIPLDLEAMLIRRDYTNDQPVFLGDTITIPPVRHGILVDGAIQHPGMQYFRPQFTVTEYIAQAGGRTRNAQGMDAVKVLDQEGKLHKYHPGIKVTPGDTIVVPERNITRGEIVQLVIASAGVILSAAAITIAATR